MGGGGIHMQLPYTVINMCRGHSHAAYTVVNVWRVNIWVEGTFTCSYHTQYIICGGLTCGGGIHVQLPYTVLTDRE